MDLKSQDNASKTAKQDNEYRTETIDLLTNKSEKEKEDTKAETPWILAHRTEVLAIHQEQSSCKKQTNNRWTQTAEDILD